MGPPVGQAAEFLSALLSQRGPQAVPYEERHKWTIREHLSELLKMFPNLSVKVSEFHTNDGRVLQLIKADGTIPIHYQAHKYNIPIVAWLPERYPVAAPLIYVCPTSNMVIKAGHSFVDPSGLVRSPCVAHWLHPSSDLSSACQEMAMLFGAEPPLYTKPPGYVAPPPPPQAGGGWPGPHQQQQAQPGQPPPAPALGAQQHAPPPGYMQSAAAHHHQQQQQQQPQGPPPDGGLAGHSIWGAAYAAAASSGTVRPPAAAALGPGSSAAAYGAVPPPQPQPQPPPPADPKQQEVADLARGFQALAARALGGRLQAGLEAYNRHAAQEMDQLLEVQRNLVARDQQLQAVVSSIQQERMGTEGLVAQLGQQSAALEAWLAAHEWKADALAASAEGAGGPDVNKVVVPADDLSRQALQAQADDLAAEDTLLVLEKAMLQGKLQPDAYMKQVRLLCRKQFMARALGLKVAQVQRQQSMLSNGQRGPGTPAAAACVLTHGDTWSHR